MHCFLSVRYLEGEQEMKRIVFAALGLLLCGIGLSGLRAAAQLDGRGGGGDVDSSRCLADATIQVTPTPSAVTWPQPTLVQWAVGLPNACGDVHVRLDGEAVGTTGSRTIVPARTSTFTV